MRIGKMKIGPKVYPRQIAELDTRLRHLSLAFWLYFVADVVCTIARWV